MPFITPTFEEIRSDILRDISNLNTKADTGVDSDYYVRASSVASVAVGLYQYHGWTVRQIFADTADTEFLEWHARTRKVLRKNPTNASGPATVTGEPNAQADAGQTINRGTLSWITTEAVVLDSEGNGSVQVRSVTAGASGNSAAVQSATFASTPVGFDSTVIIGVLSGGTDEESDTELLARYLDILRRPPAGGNKYDYKRWAMSVDGVTGAYVYPLRRGLGTVDVVITSANGTPSTEIIQATQDYIDDVRPVTAKNTLVLAPTFKIIDLDIKVALQGITLAAATVSINDVIASYVGSLLPGETFIRSQSEMLVSSITGVTDRLIVSPAANVVPVVDATMVEWIRLGVVTVGTL
ncbi:TPA: baseplate J/gp47 family protein [Yersinia enterocolitica]|nr:baseplate J/gp47 family protein [Yersinia enterocolitica]